MQIKSLNLIDTTVNANELVNYAMTCKADGPIVL